MNAGNVETGWLQQQGLDGVTDITIECDHLDMMVEVDENLEGLAQLVAQPAENVPLLTRSGSELLIKQSGRYRGKVTPIFRLPASACPEIGVRLGKGDLSFQQVQADVVVRLGMGDVELVDGEGDARISLGKGDVAVVGRTGNLTVKSGMGDTAVSRCAGSVSVSVGKGDVAIVESGSVVTIKSGSGDVAVARMTGGRLEINSGNGDIAVRDGEASEAYIRTGKGDIWSTVRLISDNPVDDAGQEEDEGAGFAIFDEDDEVDFGDIQFEATDDGVRVARGSRDILRLGPNGIQIRGSKREISLGPDGIRVGDAGSLPGSSERFAFETGRGDLNVSLPNDVNLRVEVLATGDVQSEVPLVTVGRPGPRGSVKRLVGVVDVAEGGPRTNVRLRTKRGDVAVHSMRVSPRATVEEASRSDVMDREEQARVILEALARGDLSINEAERLLQGLDHGD